MRLVGAYAIAPTWGDGHDTGFYTFDTLRATAVRNLRRGARNHEMTLAGSASG